MENLQTLHDAITRAAASDYAIIVTLGGFALAGVDAGDHRVCSASCRSRCRNARRSSARAWHLAHPRRRLVGLVARQSLALIAVGLLLGLAGGVAVGFGMRGVLFGTVAARIR